MRHAMKMVLIPESEYRRLKPEGGIKDKMNKLLSGKHDYKTATDMSQLFGRYLRTTQPDQQPTPQPLDKDQIISQLPAIYHNKISKFLTYLENHGSSWTNQNELVLKSGDVVGNIVDLLKQAFVAKIKGPSEGWKKFLEEIIDANVPLSFFTKKSTKEDLEHLRPWANY